MAKRRPGLESLGAIRDELSSFIDSFDPKNAEDAQIRTDALISSMIRAGVLKESRSTRNFRLHLALERVQLPLPKREELVARAEMFHDLINSYDGEPDEIDMETARTLLEEIGKALHSAINDKMKKGQKTPKLFDDIEG